MIVIEHKLRDIIDTFPEVELSGSNTMVKPFFSWGTKEALDKYIKGYKSSCYPLIWLMPSEEIENRRAELVTSNLTLIIATLEVEQELYNAQRYVKSFDKTLLPLSEMLKKSFDLSSNTRLVSPENIRQYKFPNYSEEGEDGNKLIDLWDAIKIEVEVEFNNNCFKPITWQD